MKSAYVDVLSIIFGENSSFI